jgi:hypothetical protein
MSVSYISKFNGPSDFSTKQPNNNNETIVNMGMPLKPATMTDGSSFASDRQAYIRMKQSQYDSTLAKNIPLSTTPYYLKSVRFLISTSKTNTSIANKYLDSSQHTNIEKINAVGRSSVNLNSKKMSFSGGSNPNDIRNALRHCRSGGCVVHKVRLTT